MRSNVSTSPAGITKLLIANRGEIAIRIARAAGELGLEALAIAPDDDADALHTRCADGFMRLPGAGVAAYLDGAAIVALARQAGCTAIHPGYGFLSENAAFAQACAQAGLSFVGPRPELLALFGDKVQARTAAQRFEVPVLRGTQGATSIDEARNFLESLHGQSIVIKAVAGGGGRGIRVVRHVDELDGAFERCRSEALAAFGNGAVYVEECFAQARHIEVQIVGDGTEVLHLGERDCTLQRRHQKLVEIAPAPRLDATLRERILQAALRLAAGVRYNGLGTFEFLASDATQRFAFIEANPRLQVEHTVTEAVTGIDLVQVQLRLAGGARLSELGLPRSSDGQGTSTQGFAVQLRVNAETMGADAAPLPSGGTLTAFESPSGPGVRVDTYGYAGYRINPRYDSLLAKVIVHHPSNDFEAVLARARRALEEFRIAGVPTNVAFLRALLDQPDVRVARLHTRWLDEHAGAVLAGTTAAQPLRHFEAAVGTAQGGPVPDAAPPGTSAVAAPMQGTVVALTVMEGEHVTAAQPVAVLEAMKLEHQVNAGIDGIVRRIAAEPGTVVFTGAALLFIEPVAHDGATAAPAEAAESGEIRVALRELLERRAKTLDAARPDAVARHHARGQRTARENVADLFDDDSFVEYGALVVAAQRLRRPLDELIDKTPADGLITGIGCVNGALFPPPASRCAVMAYDYTVLAGTQGINSHRKIDRMVDVAAQLRLPVVLFSGGGGGRPGDIDFPSGQDTVTFTAFAQLSGLVPVIGINAGPCFAGNACLLGCCDAIIATRDSSIGMGGPAMVEGGGLGVYKTEDIGPVAVQASNGVIDIVVADEAEGVRVAKQYLSYFQGLVTDWACADQQGLRTALPATRVRGYDPRTVIELLADTGSFLELRREFGAGIVTGFIRIEGRPMGLLANNPMHLGGAIDADAADKGARFMQLCDAFDIPIVSLVDNPGIMVGPEAEKAALVRHASRLFLVGANLSVPFCSVVLRKIYGLGGVAMYGGAPKTPLFTVAWPSGEYGAWGIEASVRLGYRNEMAAISDPAQRQRFYDEKVAEQYRAGTALNMASMHKLDDVIDPADTRRWIIGLLASVKPAAPRTGKKRAMVDAW